MFSRICTYYVIVCSADGSMNASESEQAV